MLNMYIEVSKTKYKYNILYYIVKYSGENAILSEHDKDYADLKDISYDIALSDVAKVLNEYCAEFEDMCIYTSAYSMELTIEFLNELSKYLYIPIKIECTTIQSKFGLSNSSSIYDVYIEQFSCSDYMTKLNMLDCLISKITLKEVLKAHKYGVLIYNLTTNKGYELFSCVCLKVSGKVEILWNKQTMFKTEHEYVAFNNFRRDMLTELQELGISKSNLLVMPTNEVSLGEYKKLCQRTEQHEEINEQNFMSVVNNCLPDTFKEIVGSSLSKLLTLMLGKIKSKHTLTAYSVGALMQTLSNHIEFKIENDMLTTRGNYIKNFYTDTFDPDMFSYMTRYFIVMDIEGNSSDGCSEIGAIIVGYSVRGKFIIALQSFYFKENEFADGLSELMAKFKAITKERNISYNYVDVYTYGNMDNYMFDNQLSISLSKTSRKKYQKFFNFVNIQQNICNAITEMNIVPQNFKQHSIANALGVEVALPKHSALNDAITLFNILAYLIRRGFHL